MARFEAELKEKPPGTSTGKMKTQKDGKAVKDKPSKDKSGPSDQCMFTVKYVIVDCAVVDSSVMHNVL